MLVLDNECKDFGQTCEMVPHLDERIVTIYPTDKNNIRDYSKPVNRLKEYTAYYECSKCGKREYIGKVNVDLDEEITLEDLINYKRAQDEYKILLEDFIEHQKDEYDKFVAEHKPVFKIGRSR